MVVSGIGGVVKVWGGVRVWWWGRGLLVVSGIEGVVRDFGVEWGS